ADGEAIPTYAFHEPGKPLQVPGPTIRVPQGTAIDLTVHSLLPVAATLHGLYTRPGKDGKGFSVGAGETKHLRFEASAAGSYPYWVRTTDGESSRGRMLDALLGGAFVVDRP